MDLDGAESPRAVFVESGLTGGRVRGYWIRSTKENLVKYALAVLVLFMALSSRAALVAENLLKNGDFEKGRMSWSMEPGLRVVPIAEALPQAPDPARGQVLAVDLHKSNRLTLSDRIRIDRKTRALVIRMKVRPGPGFAPLAADVPQFTLRMEYSSGGAIFVAKTIDPKGDWQDVKWDFPDLRNNQQFKFVVEFHPGAGIFLVDDILIEEIQ